MNHLQLEEKTNPSFVLEVKWKTWYSELEPLRLCGCVRQMYGRSTTTVEAFKSGTELAKTKKKEMGAYNVRTFSSKKKKKQKAKTIGSYAERLKSSTPLQQQLADVSRLQA